MRCPFCQNTDSRVLESRSAEAGQSVRRRRECLQCGRRFTTYERIEFAPIAVVKRNGKKEPFERAKLLAGMMRACEKTNVSRKQLDSLAKEIEAELQQRSTNEVPSNEIGRRALDRLYEIDRVAYVRFASVYYKFQNVGEFAEILERLEREVSPAEAGAVATRQKSSEEVNPLPR